ncbi:MAG: hypothetical protein H6Q19_237 [Bacteroidetes bacterium]|nr:hypothetical protein [Bacteroidota bacterium]
MTQSNYLRIMNTMENNVNRMDNIIISGGIPYPRFEIITRDKYSNN